MPLRQSHGLRRLPLAAVLLACGAIGLAAPALADAPIPVELNKLEALTQGGTGCRVYMVVQNPDADAIEQLRLDLIMFGTDGVITRRIALDLAPLPPKKTSVKLFDLAGLGCDEIGRVLVNDVLACQTGKDTAPGDDKERAACLDRLALSSKAKAPLEK